MYIMSTIHVATRWLLITKAFIDHGDTSTTATLALLQPPLWLAVLGAVVFSVNTLIADCVLIWRCWVIWSRNWIIILLPAMCTVAGGALGFRSIAEQAAYVLNPKLDRAAFVDFATPYFALSLVTTSLATILIVFRIMTMSEPATRKSKGYGKLIEIIVESAALYSVALIVFLPFLVQKSNDDAYPQAVLAQMTGIGPTLIVARVSFGLARPEETWQSKGSSLMFGKSARSAPTATSVDLSRMDGSEGTKRDSLDV
ncbi:hypothetical protein B0H17DRAFT_1104685 [Mycena rosella]|uniref:Uncharacterized protein n=1 Tax=Mycena rosella TaxID=1033263 RepID=A0AAD7FU42_MYCRO|nr:hypothetical protein B0H17DRAFT_1104685 [Mycena rosella]